MAEREVHSFAPQSRGKLSRFTGKAKLRSAARLAYHFQVVPCNPVPQARTYSLHSRLFGGKTSRQALGGIHLGSAVSDLFRSKDTGQKAVAKALHSSPDPAYLNHINSCAYNHLR